MEEELKRRSGVWAPVTPQKSKSKPTGNNGGDQNCGEKVGVDGNIESKNPKKRKEMKRYTPKIYDETKHMKWNVSKPSTPKPKTPPQRRPQQFEKRKKKKYVKKSCFETSVDQFKDVNQVEYAKISCKKKLDFDDRFKDVDHAEYAKVSCNKKRYFDETAIIHILLPTEKQRRSALDNPLSFKCVLNLRPLAKIRKNRSQNHDLFSFLNLLSVVRRKRSKTRSRSRCSGETAVQVENNCTVGMDSVEEPKLVNDNYVNGEVLPKLVPETSVQADSKCALIEETKLVNDIYVNGEGLPKLVPKSYSRHRIIKTSPLKYSLKLIPRKVPPNLERNYVLSSRDDVAYVEYLINFAIRKFSSLRISENGSQIVVPDENCSQIVARDENCSQIVARYENGSQIVVPDEKVRKNRKSPKVDLDAQTIRVWNKMENSEWKENIEDDENEAAYWAKEIAIFVRRAELFIKVMNLVQGNRRFSPWGGSQVTSIIGVYLTQNVSDNLSSDAFMELRAAYPAKVVNTNSSNNNQKSTADAHSVTNSNEVDESTESTEQSSNNENKQSCSFGTETVTIEDEKIVESQESNDFNTIEDEKIVESQESNDFNTRIGTEQGNTKQGNGKKRDWDKLRRAIKNYQKVDVIDSVDWEAVHQAPVEDIAKVIVARGMNNILAGRIKDFLDRIIKDHGSINLEWLKNVSERDTKEFLLSIDGLGLKSVECVRLLSLHQHAFPVDTNVGRIVVRLGWIPLRDLPEDIPFHLLKKYPGLDAIQKYLWPRLAKLDMLTLYELHYQLITAGKIFCTKKSPNCNACPMRAECKHFASAYAWSKRNHFQVSHGETNKESPATHNEGPQIRITLLLPDSTISEMWRESGNCEPVIEMPPSPEPSIEMPQSPELGPSEMQYLERDIEDIGCESEDGIPIIRLNEEKFKQTVQVFMESFGYDMSKALQCIESIDSFQGEIPISSLVVSTDPTNSQKHVDKKRSIYDVYELPDSHPLLEGFEKRYPDDPCPYLLLISKTDGAKTCSPESRKLNDWLKSPSCDNGTCGSGHCFRCQKDISLEGTILIPCRTANRGEFPLNGTYFQVNEVFADHETSTRPIPVPRDMLRNLKKWFLFCGNSVTSICKGMSTRGIQYCFWQGFVCIRGFDKSSRRPKMLSRRLHIHTSTRVDDD